MWYFIISFAGVFVAALVVRWTDVEPARVFGVFAVFLLLWSLYYPGRPLSKDRVDLAYYSLGIVGLTGLFIVDREKRNAAELERSYDIVVVTESDLRREVELLRQISRDPDVAYALMVEELGQCFDQTMKSIGARPRVPLFPLRDWRKLMNSGSLSEFREAWKNRGSLEPLDGDISFRGTSYAPKEFAAAVATEPQRIEVARAELADATREKERLAYLIDQGLYPDARGDHGPNSDRGGYGVLKVIMSHSWPYVVALMLGMKLARKNVFHMSSSKS